MVTWTTDKKEKRVYSGFCIMISLLRMPDIHDYWSKDLTFRYSPIGEILSRKRFEELSQYLHFVVNRSLPA